MSQSFLGNILWRQVLERDPTGNILFLSPTSSGETLIVSGGPKALVRAFDPITGALAWEWPVPASISLDRYGLILSPTTLICHIPTVILPMYRIFVRKQKYI